MLTKIKFAPGIDKQDTAVGADGRWVDSANVRFRYGLPEKVKEISLVPLALDIATVVILAFVGVIS